MMATKFRINLNNLSLQRARPIVTYNRMITVWEDATDEEVERIILKDHEYYMIHDER